MSIDKKELRKEIKRRKQLLSAADKEAAAAAIAHQLSADQRFAQCDNIVAYWAMDDEVPTQAMIEAWSLSHRVYLPVIVGDELQFRLYTGSQSLTPDSQFSIPEPKEGELLPYGSKSTAIIVPGVAFSASGARMGRGRGYYDRILKAHSQSYKIGIAFACQQVEYIPTEPHDVAMDCVYFG